MRHEWVQNKDELRWLMFFIRSNQLTEAQRGNVRLARDKHNDRRLKRAVL